MASCECPCHTEKKLDISSMTIVEELSCRSCLIARCSVYRAEHLRLMHIYARFNDQTNDQTKTYKLTK